MQYFHAWIHRGLVFHLIFTLGLFNYCYFTYFSVSLHLTPINLLNTYFDTGPMIVFLIWSWWHQLSRFFITAPICYKCVNETRSWPSYRHLDVNSQYNYNMHSRIYGILMNGKFISTILVKHFVCMYICDSYILHSMYHDVSVIIQGKNV
jgi:hypothetical protein